MVADPLEAARDHDHAHPPLAHALVAPQFEQVADDAPVAPIDQLVEIGQRLGRGDIALGKRVERDLQHLFGSRRHLVERLQERRVRREAMRQLRELRDRHAVVAGPLDRAADVQEREDAPQVARDRRVEREQALDREQHAPVHLVDLVVVRDHLVGERQIAPIERVHAGAESPQHASALLLHVGLELVEILIERLSHA